MVYKVYPHNGVQPIFFGMNSEKIESLVGIKPKKFKKYENSETLSDDFECFHAHYKSNGKCEALEFFSNADLLYYGINIFNKPYNELEVFFERIDKAIETNGCGLITYRFGVCLYAPFAKEDPTKPVESALVFEDGLYEKYSSR